MEDNALDQIIISHLHQTRLELPGHPSSPSIEAVSIGNDQLQLVWNALGRRPTDAHVVIGDRPYQTSISTRSDVILSPRQALRAIHFITTYYVHDGRLDLRIHSTSSARFIVWHVTPHSIHSEAMPDDPRGSLRLAADTGHATETAYVRDPHLVYDLGALLAMYDMRLTEVHGYRRPNDQVSVPRVS